MDEFMSLMDGYDKNDCPDLDLSYQTLIKMQSKLKESFGDKILMVKSNVNKFIEGDSWKVITDDGVEVKFCLFDIKVYGKQYISMCWKSL